MSLKHCASGVCQLERAWSRSSALAHGSWTQVAFRCEDAGRFQVAAVRVHLARWGRGLPLIMQC